MNLHIRGPKRYEEQLLNKTITLSNSTYTYTDTYFTHNMKYYCLNAHGSKTSSPKHISTAELIMVLLANPWGLR